VTLCKIAPYRNSLTYFGVIAAYCSNFGHFAFLSPLWGLRDNIHVHIGLTGKHVVDILLVLIELFWLGVTAEVLREKTDQKLAISLQQGQFGPKLHVQRVAPPIIFARIAQWMLYNFVADNFHTKKVCSRLSSSECDFTPKTTVLHFWAPSGGFRGNVRSSS